MLVFFCFFLYFILRFIFFQDPPESRSFVSKFNTQIFFFFLLCVKSCSVLLPPKPKNINVSRVKARMIEFLRWTMCALNPCFVINAPENYSTPLPAQQQGQIYRKLLLAARRDKAGDIKTSILACGIVQPAWITLLYTWEYNTWGNVHLGHRGSSSSWPFEPRHESFSIMHIAK